jgi:hypothetical protein
MRKSILIAIAAGLVSSAAFAESPTPWPRYPHQGIENQAPGVAYKGAPAPGVNAWTAPFAPYADWRAIPAAHDAHTVSYGVTAKQLDAQQREYRKYWLARHRELTATGEWADVLPVRIAEKLNRDSLGAYKPPFGSPVMGGDN